jgi:hypothetical protein
MWIVLVLVSLTLMAGLVGLDAPGPVSAVGVQQPPSPQPIVGPPAPLLDRARQDLARRLGVSAAQVTVAEASPMTWSSLALGCPAPGIAYAAVETPGFQLVLDVFGQRYTYNTDTRETFVLCVQGQGAPDAQVLSASGLMAALLERGVRVEVADAYAELPFLRADGTRYRLSGGAVPDGAEIQVYDYRDLVALADDAARIGPDGQPTSGRVEWARPPRFFRSGSVLVLTIDGAQPLADMLTELLGPPFAGASATGAPPASPPPPPSSLPPAPPPPAGLPPAPLPPGGGLPSSMPPADASVPRISWDEAKALIMSGKVQQAFQTHALEVRLYLKDGTSVATTETRIDEVFQVARDCGAPCSDIMIATE